MVTVADLANRCDVLVALATRTTKHLRNAIDLLAAHAARERRASNLASPLLVSIDLAVPVYQAVGQRLRRDLLRCHGALMQLPTTTAGKTVEDVTDSYGTRLAFVAAGGALWLAAIKNAAANLEFNVPIHHSLLSATAEAAEELQASTKVLGPLLDGSSLATSELADFNRLLDVIFAERPRRPPISTATRHDR